jgi:hypothetical protein
VLLIRIHQKHKDYFVFTYFVKEKEEENFRYYKQENLIQTRKKWIE